MTYFADFLFCLTKGQSFGLGKEVTEQNAVMKGVGNGVMRDSRSKEVCRNELRALVDKLVERMLAVRSSCSPEDGLE